MGTKKNPGRFDYYEKAADNEPIFVLKATDICAPATIRAWVNFSLQQYAGQHVDLEKLREALSCAEAMEYWLATHHSP